MTRSHPAIAGHLFVNDARPFAMHLEIKDFSMSVLRTIILTRKFALTRSHPAIAGHLLVNDARKTNIAFGAACFSFAFITLYHKFAYA